jgi:RES domain-containing protein
MAKRAFFRVVARTRSGDAALVSVAGRFNTKDSPSTCYVADEIRTAWAEVTAGLGAVPADPTKFKALRIEVDEDRLYDLDSEEDASALLTVPAPPAARTFADRLRRESEHSGISYRSVRRSGGLCVALFLEKIDLVTVEELDAHILLAALRHDAGE